MVEIVNRSVLPFSGQFHNQIAVGDRKDWKQLVKVERRRRGAIRLPVRERVFPAIQREHLSLVEVKPKVRIERSHYIRHLFFIRSVFKVTERSGLKAQFLPGSVICAKCSMSKKGACSDRIGTFVPKRMLRFIVLHMGL